MLSTLLRTMLAIELLFHVWLGGHFLQGGMRVGAVLALVVMIAMLWRISQALLSFMLATAMRWRDRRSLPFGNALAALASEFKARSVIYNWSQPFDGLAIGRDPVGASTDTSTDTPAGTSTGMPVLLVHGYVCNRGLWVRFRRLLADARLGPVYTISMEPLFGSIDTMASRLAARVEAICRDTGRDQIAIVAHSMGGLIVRAYLAHDRAARVARLITLGSPHHGTRMASLGIGDCARQMRWQSAWLADLAHEERVHPRRVPTLSVYSLSDDLVYPPESGVLPWAENVPVTALGHVALVFSGAVANRVIAFLRQPVH